MKGFSVEPGERNAARHVDLTGAADVEIIRRGDARQHFAGRMIDGEDGDGNIRPKHLRTVARQLFEPFLQASVRSSGGAACAPARRRRPRRRHAARAWAAPARVAATGSFFAAQFRRPQSPRMRRCDRARGRARCRASAADRSGRRASGDCGSATSKRGFATATAAAAPCRNRRATAARTPSRLPP